MSMMYLFDHHYFMNEHSEKSSKLVLVQICNQSSLSYEAGFVFCLFINFRSFNLKESINNQMVNKKEKYAIK